MSKRVTVTGATGLIGTKLVERLQARGDQVTVLSRDARKAKELLGADAVGWDAATEPAPAAALEGRDAVVHLAGEPVAQRWNAQVKQRINDSREVGTRLLVEGIAATTDKPGTLVSSSAIGFYGHHGDEQVTEDDPAGSDFLAEVCVRWEREARKAEALGLRVGIVRVGIVLDRDGGALATMLTPFKLGVGGPIAGGKQYMPWIHVDDVVGIFVQAVDDERWSGPVNATGPAPVTNKVFSKALGKALKRPAFAPVPRAPLKVLYGEMADVISTGANVVPKRTQELGYTFAHPQLDEALRSALAK